MKRMFVNFPPQPKRRTRRSAARHAVSRPFLRASALLAICLACPSGAAYADIIHLTSGGALEGEIIEQTPERYRIRTTGGIIAVAADAVVRVEHAPSPFQEYAARREQVENTPDDHFELAQWCEQRGLAAPRREHLQRALELDYDHAAARAAAGFVRVGELWVEGRTVLERAGATRPDPAARDAQTLVSAVQLQWHRQIRAIQTNLLDAVTPKLAAEGRRRIDEINDPLAIVPLVQVLARGGRASREALVAALSRFPQDESTLNLAVFALVEPESAIRRAALNALSTRNDARVVVQFRRAMHTDNDVLIARAAEALGVMKATSGIPDLIGALKVQRRRLVEVPVQRYLGEWSEAYSASDFVTIGGGTRVVYTPQLAVAAAGDFAVETRLEMRDVTRYRTEVLEALKQITGQNFGFDDAAWSRWYEEYTR